MMPWLGILALPLAAALFAVSGAETLRLVALAAIALLSAWGAALAVIQGKSRSKIDNLEKNLSSVRESGQVQLRSTSHELARL
ncbi:MAG: hypothetical protein QME74_05760, partial [Candidatus Edwardsbacteria bacterium]|nr:hypothetical protein [Candidatus Edwardsbacteria bacterium]